MVAGAAWVGLSPDRYDGRAWLQRGGYYTQKNCYYIS